MVTKKKRNDDDIMFRFQFYRQLYDNDFLIYIFWMTDRNKENSPSGKKIHGKCKYWHTKVDFWPQPRRRRFLFVLYHRLGIVSAVRETPTLGAEINTWFIQIHGKLFQKSLKKRVFNFFSLWFLIFIFNLYAPQW